MNTLNIALFFLLGALLVDTPKITSSEVCTDPMNEKAVAKMNEQAALKRTTFVTAGFKGQLGNQMFEVAAAVAYALEHGYRAIFPAVNHADGGEANSQYIFHRLDRTSPPCKDAIVYQENRFAPHYTIYAPIPFEETQLEETRFIVLDGYFQTPKYFEHYSDHIRKLFAPSDSILRQIRQQYGHLLKQKTVAIHIRTFTPDGRDPNQSIGVRGWKFFQLAMTYFPSDALFLVFSDDMSWVKRNFPESILTRHRVEFISGNPHWFEFYLMSLCQHQILPPESTFSWWAAWLNPNPNKKVIVPTWAYRPDTELFPADWIKIKESDL